MTTLVIDAYLRQDGGSLHPGKVAVEYADRYATGRKTWWLADTIIELGKPYHTELRGWSELHDGPAIELAPLVIPAVEVARMSRIEYPPEDRLADECHGYDLDGNTVGREG